MPQLKVCRRCRRNWWACGSAAGAAGAGAGLAGVALTLAALGWVHPAAFTQPSGTLEVSLLQGNVPQDEKFSAQHLARTLAWLDQALRAGAAPAATGHRPSSAAAATLLVGAGGPLGGCVLERLLATRRAG